jgi:hypothetical protein
MPVKVLIMSGGLTLPDVTEDELARIREAAGDAEVILATSRGEVLEYLPEAEVVLGVIDRASFGRAVQLRWLHAAQPQIGTGDSGESIRVFQWIVFFFAAGALLSFLSAYAAGFLRPLQFADEMATEPAMVSGRARVPLPQERPRRQRGVREPAGQRSGHAQGKRSPKSGS